MLVINHGLIKPFLQSGEGRFDALENAQLVLDYRGIPDITQHYSAIILDWCGYSSIERSNKTEHRVSQDIQKVIKALQQHMRKLGISEGVPVIISSHGEVSSTHSVNMNEALFLARRILSGNEGHNERRIALVKRKVKFSKNVMELMKKAHKKYSRLEIIPQDLITFREVLFEKKKHGDNTYDTISLHFGAKYVCAVDLNDLNEEIPPEEFEGQIHTLWKKKSKRKRIEFSSEPELRNELGMQTLLEECQKLKTARCGVVYEYEKVDTDLIRNLVWACHPKIDIPDFLGKCPKI